jgi:hypothetical protein
VVNGNCFRKKEHLTSVTCALRRSQIHLSLIGGKSLPLPSFRVLGNGSDDGNVECQSHAQLQGLGKERLG